MILSHCLINYASFGNSKGLLCSLDRINDRNKDDFYQQNDAGFNCLHAFVGSRYIRDMRRDEQREILIAIVNKSVILGDPKRHKQFMTEPSCAGFTPMHSAVYHRNYSIASILYDKTVEAFGERVAGGGAAELYQSRK